MNSGIPAEVIKEIKTKWPNIYSVKIGEYYFIFRLLSRGEFGVMVELQSYNSGQEEDYIYETCVLYSNIFKKDIDTTPAGTIPELVKIIIEMSGFSSSDYLMKYIEMNRSVMDLADSQMTIVICKAFPHLTPEDINNFDIQKITYYLALAEQILGVTLEIPNTKNKVKHKPNLGFIDFEQENKDIFKSDISMPEPKKDPNTKKLKRGNVG